MKHHIKLSRRGFIKASGALMGAATLIGCSAGKTDYSYSDITEPRYTETKYSCACLNNCANGCRLYGHVRNGRLVKMSRAPMPDERYSRACLRGLSHMQRMYNSNRVLYPMKRKPGAERGSRDSFMRISWKQAISEITERFNKIRENPEFSGDRSLAYWTTSGSFATINGLYISYSKLFDFLGSMKISSTVDLNVAQGYSIPFGTLGPLCLVQSQPSDLNHAKTIIFWGTNFASAHIQSWHHAASARDNNDAELISIDIMLSGGAARSDKFVCLRPGSDTHLALSMIKYITDNDNTMVDFEFMLKNTVAPLLVYDDGPAKGTFVRDSNKNFIAYKSGAFVSTTPHATLTGKAALDGVANDYNFNYTGNYTDGIAVKTVYVLLKEFVAPYDASITAPITGVDPAVTEAIATRYATVKPATISSGFGPDHRTNGHHIYHAISILAALTGNLGKPGAGVGVSEVMTPYFNGADLGSSSNGKSSAGAIPYGVFKDVFNSTNEITTYDHFGTNIPIMAYGGPDEKFKDVPTKVRGLFIAYGNIVSNYCETAKSIGAEGIFKKKNPDGSYKMDTIVVADTEWTDTAIYADYILPVCHWFEHGEDFNGFGSHPYAVYQEDIPELQPLGESKSDIDIARLFAKSFGAEEDYSKTNAELFDAALASHSMWYKSMTGRAPVADEIVTPDRLRREKVVRVIPGRQVASGSEEYIYPMWREGDDILPDLRYEGYNGTGRVEFYTNVVLTFANFGQTTIPSGVIINSDLMDKERFPFPETPHEGWHEDTYHNSAIRAAGYTLNNFSQRIRWRVHTQWWNTPWIRELEPYPVVFISPTDAAAKLIVTGDVIEVSNLRGSYRGKAIITAGLQPGVIDAPRGWQRWQYNEFYGEEAGYANTSIVANDAGSCNDVTSTRTHPLSGCAAFFDTLVKIEKITKN